MAATIDKMLVRQVKGARKPRYFAFVEGSEENLLTASPKGKIPKPKTDEMKKKAGGTKVLPGVMKIDENGVLVFQIDKAPPGGLEAKIRRAVKESTGLKFEVRVEQVTDFDPVDENESEEGESTEGTAEDDTASRDQLLVATRAAVKSRIDHLAPRVEALRASDPNSPALAGLQAALDKVLASYRAAEAAAASDPDAALANYESASKELEPLGGMLDQALAASGGAATTATDGANRQAEFLAQFKATKGLLAQLTGARPKGDAEVADLLAGLQQAGQTAKIGLNYAGGLEQIADVTARLQKALAAKTEPGGDGSGEAPKDANGAPPGDAEVDPEKVEALQQAWKQSSELALDGVLKITASLRNYSGEDAAYVADVLDGLVDGFPGSLSDALDAMEIAAIAADTGAFSKARSQARASVKECLDYLKGNAATITACENNPFGLNLPIAAPLKQSLKDILQNVG